MAEVAANAMVVDVGSIVEDEASAKRLATLDFSMRSPALKIAEPFELHLATTALCEASVCIAVPLESWVNAC